MKIKIETNADQLKTWSADTIRQARFARQGAINDTAFAVRKAEIDEMRTKFDRPTPYVTNALKVEMADRKKGLDFATIGFQYIGGKGADPNDVLRAQIEGGRRALKKFELRFQRAGILPNGYAMVPGRDVPLNAYGNVSNTFLVRLLAYFNTFREAGYDANMTDAGRARMAKKKRYEKGKSYSRASERFTASATYTRTNGVRYFVSRGRLRPNTAHLAEGIWQSTGIQGSDIRPVFLFVPLPSYRKRFEFYQVAERVVRAEFSAAFERRLVQGLATARRGR